MANTRLREYLDKSFVNISALARSMGVTRQALAAKIDGTSKFNQADLIMIKERLALTDEEFLYLFFDDQDEKVSTKEVTE